MNRFDVWFQILYEIKTFTANNTFFWITIVTMDVIDVTFQTVFGSEFIMADFTSVKI